MCNQLIEGEKKTQSEQSYKILDFWVRRKELKKKVMKKCIILCNLKPILPLKYIETADTEYYRELTTYHHYQYKGGSWVI